jgi:hypothetical protein
MIVTVAGSPEAMISLEPRGAIPASDCESVVAFIGARIRHLDEQPLTLARQMGRQARRGAATG